MSVDSFPPDNGQHVEEAAARSRAGEYSGIGAGTAYSRVLALVVLMPVIVTAAIISVKCIINPPALALGQKPGAAYIASENISAGNTKVPAAQSLSAKTQATPPLGSLLIEAAKHLLSNPARAQKILEDAVSAYPDDYDAIMMLAGLLAFRKDYGPAIDQYKNALRVNSQSIEACYELGSAYLARGDCEAAIRSLQSCLALMPPNRDEVLAKLGFCYSKMKMFETAQAFFKQALEVNPKNETARAFMSQQSSPNVAYSAPARVEGKYLVEGQNPSGTKYSGTAVISRSDDGYAIAWDIANEPFAGSSFSDRAVAIKWTGSGGKGGLAVYTPAEDGVLKGIWASGSGLETLTPVK